jgi:serralysin
MQFASNWYKYSTSGPISSVFSTLPNSEIAEYREIQSIAGQNFSFENESNWLVGGVTLSFEWRVPNSGLLPQVFQLVNYQFDSLLSLDQLEISDEDLLTGNDSIIGAIGNDYILGWGGNDYLFGGLGNDSLIGGFGNDTIDGGAGYDYSVYDANKSSIVGASKDISGIVTLQTGFGTDTLINIEELSFLDGNLTIDNLITQYSPAVYQTNVGNVTANIYTGAVSFLQFEMLGSSNGDIVTGSASNDFINLLGGDDAANGGAGQDVLDGGTGSNFLTGGSGADTFFLDGRSGTNTWSTITDFANEDNVNIWGWQQGTSQLILSLDGQGAEGFKGATFHYDLNGNGLIDTSITFSDLVLASLPSPSVEVVAGFGYLLFA